jgi:hypothetical protein
MKKMLLPMIALVVAVSLSAFTKIQRTDSDLVWFEVNSSGQALHPTDGGVQGDTSPFGCSTGTLKCATALSISQNEVQENMDGSYQIASGVDITSSSYYNAREFKSQ